MSLPLEITLRDIPHSEAVETRIREKAEKLTRFNDRIMSCHVTVESPQRHKHQGKLYSVHVDIRLPAGVEVVVTRVQDEDVFVAIRDAFAVATRRIEEHSRKLRGEVKAHDVPHHARVTKLFPAQGYGFIQTPDGREVYFHRNSVNSPTFEDLEIGSEVFYTEEEGNEGPQARSLTMGKHRIPD